MSVSSILGVLGLGVFLAATAHAQDLVLTETDWQVECGPAACSLTRSMLEETSGNRFASIAFALSPAEPEARMAIFTPLGTAVQKPLTLKIGTDAREMRFTTCLAEGCVVLDNIAMDVLNGLTILPTISLSFFAAEGETPVMIPVPMAGLSDAIADAMAQLEG